MPTLLETLGEVLSSGSAVDHIGRKIGSDEQTAGSALSAALPLLIGALSKNASSVDGAQGLLNALSRDHDGSILDNLDDFIDNSDSGQGDGILRHVFGSNRPRVESSIGKSTGLDAGSIAKLLTIAAPIVLGALGRSQRSRNMDSNELSNLLSMERREIENREPQSVGIMNQLLDTDGDGDVDLTDIARSGLPKLLGGLFSR